MRIRRGIWTALALSLGLWAALAALRNAEPVRNLHLTTHRNGVLIYGENRFGYRTFRNFASWTSMRAYLQRHGLSTPVISHAQRGTALDAVALPATGRAYKVVWNRHLPEPPLLYAPDASTAGHMAEYVKYYGIRATPYGFGLSLGGN